MIKGGNEDVFFNNALREHKQHVQLRVDNQTDHWTSKDKVSFSTIIAITEERSSKSSI